MGAIKNFPNGIKFAVSHELSVRFVHEIATRYGFEWRASGRHCPKAIIRFLYLNRDDKKIGKDNHRRSFNSSFFTEITTTKELEDWLESLQS